MFKFSQAITRTTLGIATVALLSACGGGAVVVQVARRQVV